MVGIDYPIIHLVIKIPDLGDILYLPEIGLTLIADRDEREFPEQEQIQQIKHDE
jgi:hypothetical protein